MVSAIRKFKTENYYWNFPRYLPIYWAWKSLVYFRGRSISKKFGDNWAGENYKQRLPQNFRQWLEALAGNHWQDIGDPMEYSRHIMDKSGHLYELEESKRQFYHDLKKAKEEKKAARAARKPKTPPGTTRIKTRKKR